MAILYSNGCSFTANFDVDRSMRYPTLIGKHFVWEVIDHALPQSCNSKIIRCTIRDCLQLLDQNEKITALIQLTFLERFEYAGDPNGANQWQYSNGTIRDEFEVIKSNDDANWPKEIRKYANSIFMHQRYNALCAQLFSNLVGLISFFKANNIKYRIFSGPSLVNGVNHNVPINPVNSRAIECKDTILQDAFYQHCISKDTNVLSLIDFNMLSVADANVPAHPTPEGMQKIADYFINLLCEQA